MRSQITATRRAAALVLAGTLMEVGFAVTPEGALAQAAASRYRTV